MGYNSQFIKNVPLNANSVSAARQVVDSQGYAIQLVFTGSTCEFSSKIQVSSDPLTIPAINGQGTQLNVPVNWDDLLNSSESFTESGTFTYNVNPAEYVWVRVVLTDNSSAANTGLISATINVKGPL